MKYVITLMAFFLIIGNMSVYSKGKEKKEKLSLVQRQIKEFNDTHKTDTLETIRLKTDPKKLWEVIDRADSLIAVKKGIKK